jgi:predicted enzyme related to lactoylglutathione lyase
MHDWRRPSYVRTMPTFQGDDVPLIIAVTIDCNDLERMSEFWSKLLGVEIAAIQDGFGFLTHAPDRNVTVWLQQVPEPSSGKARIHLDLSVPDLEAAETRIEALGGKLLDRHGWEGYEWRMCEDPEGNVFDVMRAPANAGETET